MARRRRFSWGFVGVGAAIGFLTLSVALGRQAAASKDPIARPKRAPTPPQPDPVPATPQSSADEARDDETALARMLTSETRKTAGRIVIGWITIQRARRSGRSLYDFLTRGKGYGPIQVDGKATGRHAATGERPTPQARDLARKLLSGELQASAAIRAHRPGSWVERKQSLTDEEIMLRQKRWQEGIYGRLAGTEWVLFSSDTPLIPVVQGKEASEVLDALPLISATDQAVA